MSEINEQKRKNGVFEISWNSDDESDMMRGIVWALSVYLQFENTPELEVKVYKDYMPGKGDWVEKMSTWNTHYTPLASKKLEDVLSDFINENREIFPGIVVVDRRKEEAPERWSRRWTIGGTPYWIANYPANSIADEEKNKMGRPPEMKVDYYYSRTKEVPRRNCSCAQYSEKEPCSLFQLPQKLVRSGLSNAASHCVICGHPSWCHPDKPFGVKVSSSRNDAVRLSAIRLIEGSDFPGSRSGYRDIDLIRDLDIFGRVRNNQAGFNDDLQSFEKLDAGDWFGVFVVLVIGSALAFVLCAGIMAIGTWVLEWLSAVG